MKKFFMIAPLQKPGFLKKYQYHACGNDKLEMDGETRFPIMTAIAGYVRPEEEFEVIVVVQNTEDAKNNCSLLREEVQAFCETKNLKFADSCIRPVYVPVDQKVTANVDIFQKLIDYVEDGDELFACITFGTKPMSMALLMLIRYAFRLLENVSVRCVVYGEVDRSGGADPSDWTGYVYDETALVSLDEITSMLAKQKVKNPKDIIRTIIGLDSEEGED